MALNNIKNMQKAVFLDKDGTLIEDVSYNTDTTKIKLLPGVAEGLRLLQNNGYKLIITTNQSGIARELFTFSQFEKAREKLLSLLKKEGVIIDDFYFCPHHPEGKNRKYSIHCNCRKPNPGMLKNAIRKYNINPAASWMVGDILHDIEAGHNADCNAILINNGNETEWIINKKRTPDFTVQTFLEATALILSLNYRKENEGVLFYGK